MQIINLEQTSKTHKSIDTYMSNDREDDSSNQSDNDEGFELEAFNNQLISLQHSQRRLHQVGGRRQSGLKKMYIEPKNMSVGKQSTTLTQTYKDLEIDREINKMIEEKEFNPETESEQYMRMTVKSNKNFNIDLINNTIPQSDELDKKQQRSVQVFHESEDENEAYNWSQDESDEKENVAENVR